MKEFKAVWFESLIYLLALVFLFGCLWNEAFGSQSKDPLADIAGWNLYFFKVDSSDIRVTDTFEMAMPGDTLLITFDQPLKGTAYPEPVITWKDHIDTTVFWFGRSAPSDSAVDGFVPVQMERQIDLRAGFYQLSVTAVDTEQRESKYSDTVLIYMDYEVAIPVRFEIIVK